jgi:hypothetical protein
LNRVAWTDERIDDAMLRIDRGFESLRDEMRELRTEMHAEFRAVRTDMSASQRQITSIGWGIGAAFLAQLVAFVLTQS